MFAPSILRRQALRAFPPLVKKPSAQLQRRLVHHVPPLKHTGEIPGLFSHEAFRAAWTDYQASLVEKLNYHTAETEFMDKPVVEIAIMAARQADLAATFNYASQAHNNHFFFESLTSQQTKMPETLLPYIPDSLRAYIPDTFSTIEAMKEEIFATAEAMFGCGWVWLVLDHGKRLRILCTYNAGTPYGEAYRRQDTDVNTGERLGDATFSSDYRSPMRASGPQKVLPLLNVNCWEHVWMTDYGVLGKRQYLEKWWDHVDWEAVAARLGSSTTLTTPRLPYMN